MLRLQPCDACCRDRVLLSLVVDFVVSLLQLADSHGSVPNVMLLQCEREHFYHPASGYTSFSRRLISRSTARCCDSSLNIQESLSTRASAHPAEKRFVMVYNGGE